MQEWIRVPACYVLPTLLCWHTLRKDSPLISNVQRNGQNFSFWTQNFNICYNLFHFIAFVNAEWLTPDEREPPACSPSAVESIGGILREEGFIVSIFLCPHDERRMNWQMQKAPTSILEVGAKVRIISIWFISVNLIKVNILLLSSLRRFSLLILPFERIISRFEFAFWRISGVW